MDFLAILIGLITILFAWAIYLLIHHEVKYGYLRKKFPGCVFFLGISMYKLVQPDNLIGIISTLNKHFNDTVVFIIYPHLRMIVNDLKLIEIILSTNMDKTVEYSYIKSWLSDGILTAKYDKWKIHKKLIAPAFSNTNLLNHIHTFNEQSLILCGKLQENLDKSFDIFKLMNLCTMDIILNTALGADIKIQDNPSSEYMKNTKTMCHVLFIRGLTSNKIDWKYNISSYKRLEKSAAQMLNNFSNKFIAERRNQKTQSGVRTILDMVLECEEFSDEDIRSEINTIIFAGHESTSSTLSFALYELGRNPEVQKKVYDEIMEVLGDGTPTYSDLEQLRYTSMVLKEVSRLYPGVPFISRITTKEIDWEGTVIPTGVDCFISLFHIHRDERYFPDPEKFDPERFNAENIKKIPAGAYIPFSMAPRGCIGQKFAQLEMKTILVHVLRQFEILPDREHQNQLVMKVTLQSKNGVRVVLKKRE